MLAAENGGHPTCCERVNVACHLFINDPNNKGKSYNCRPGMTVCSDNPGVPDPVKSKVPKIPPELPKPEIDPLTLTLIILDVASHLFPLRNLVPVL